MEASRGVGFIEHHDPMALVPIVSQGAQAGEDSAALPDEIILLEIVFKHLTAKELGALVLTSKNFSVLASAPALWREIFDREGLSYFDEKKCRKYRGEPGNVPKLSWPREYGFYNSPCTLEPGKLRKDTGHRLQLFYGELDRKPTTMKLVGEQAQTPKPGSDGIAACFYQSSWQPALDACGEEPLGDSFWGYYVIKPLGHGKLKAVEEKVADASRHPEYIISKPVVRAIANFDSVVQGEGYVDGPGTYAICDRIVQHDFGNGVVEVRVALGGGARAPAGLRVLGGYFYDACTGVGLLRKC